MTHLHRRKLKYFVTPKGLTHNARLTKQSMEGSLRVYRELRQAARETLAQVREHGHATVKASAKDDAMEISRLTCLELGLDVRTNPAVPLTRLQVEGTRFVLEWPG